jgi:hydrogenase maturation protein HypF
VFLLHDRRIHVPCDDSVIRVFQGADLPIRRSRGYAPYPVRLPFAALPVLAVGGELKSTACVAVGDEAVLSQHIGDMENVETVAAFTRIAAHLGRLFRVRPERIACDQHPGYLSRRWAVDEARRLNLHLVQVQHHHAHIASVMAEHLVPPGQTVIGFSFDGTGYGTDGAIWGGELLLAGYGEFRRAAHLRYIPLPGGDSAIRHPYRCALAHLWAANIAWDDDLAPVLAARSWELRVLERQMRGGVRVVPCSSMGRLFDAVAALIGLTQSVTYEAQAAMEMEAQLPDADQMADADPLACAAGYAFSLPWAEEEMSTISIDPAPVLRALVADLRRGTPAAVMAERFHGSVAAMVLALSLRMRDKEGLDTVALSGGVWQNTRLLAMVKAACEARGFRVLCHHLVPPNDGGLALGQAAIASQSVPRASRPDDRDPFRQYPVVTEAEQQKG